MSEKNRIEAREPERALALVGAACRRCGDAVLFLRRSDYPGDLVPVECACGWVGVCPVAMEIK